MLQSAHAQIQAPVPKRKGIAMDNLNETEELFLKIANDPQLRSALLERLERSGLLSAFLQAESGTK